MFKPVSPQTDFPALERELLDKWYKNGIVEKYLKKNSSSGEKFSFLDGPITANNPMGVHHAWGRTYKDFWQRFWNMKGKRQRFQNGFDEQGLWVEVEVEKELGLKSKKDIENLVPGDKFKSLEKFINLCKERVVKFAAVQTEQSKRLGYFMDWDNSYHTSSSENNYTIWEYIKKVHEKGWLYKGRDSVPWCPRCGTAISQHEILTEEYKELTHRTVVFKLKIKGRASEYLLAWTTTPWTIPGNIALAVDPSLMYWKLSNGKETVYLVNPEQEGEFQKDETLVVKQKLTEGFEKVDEVKGADLIGLEYVAPYDSLPAVKKALEGYSHRVIASDPLVLPINPSEGTGIVHVATGAGGEDFRLGKKEKLPVAPEIDEAGVFMEGFDFLSGQHVKKAMPLIIEDLTKRILNFKDFDYTHRYPTCWRCKTELVWRVVDEWYISMDRPSHKASDGKSSYREMMMDVAKKIKWMPDFGLERELDWLKNMHDWLISKKRYWGLALPIWECNKCGNFDVIGSYDELKEKAVEGFDKFEGHSPHRPWVDQIKIKCSKCGNLSSRIPDVGNPWLDAGIVSFSTMSKEWFPADFITESFPGQFKNWFYSLIAMSTVIAKSNPFKRVLGFASVRDEKGEEMHKSKGNAIEFNEAADKIGVDVMRWLYLRQDPEQNLNFGYHTADEVRRYFHLRLWNVYSFFTTYANLNNFTPTKDLSIPLENVLDKWIVSRLNESIRNVSKFVEAYQADKAVEDIENFVVNDLSNWYVRRSRDRVALYSEDKKDKEACLTTLWLILTQYSKLLASFIPFISEEIYTNLTGEESVHLADWPEFNEELIDGDLNKEMEGARWLASTILGMRKVANVKVRIPFRKIMYSGPRKLSNKIIDVVKSESNVYDLEFLERKADWAGGGELDKSNQDTAAGEARDIIRKIQDERKKIGTKPADLINASLPDWPKEFEEEIKRKTLTKNLSKGEFKIEIAS